MKNTRNNKDGMTTHGRLLSVFVAAVVALVLGFAAPAVLANDENEIPFDEANIFFELNDTDGDLGIHGLIDGEAWKELEIEDPRGRELLEVQVKSRLRRQGLTEIFFESAEPNFDDLAPEKFFRRFPEGTYEIEGETLEGDELESTAVLTHVMPAPPEDIEISASGKVISAAEDCDADPLPSVPVGDVTISWAPVTLSHPEIGRTGETIEVVKYQLVVEREEPTLLIYSVDLAPEVTEFRVPKEFFLPGGEFKFEILVREASGNQTAVESCFEIEDE